MRRRVQTLQRSYDAVMADRKRFAYPGIPTYYRTPLLIAKGEGMKLTDVAGKEYLDFFAGILTVSVGHCHPRVTRVLQQQAASLVHLTSIYANTPMVELSKELVRLAPPPLSSDKKDEWVAYITNTGSEANDLACFLARGFTKRFDVIALRNAYHGFSEFTRGLTALSTWRHEVPTSFGVRHAMLPDPFRGPFGDDGAAYAAELKSLIDYTTPGAVAGFIMEPIQGVGGAVVPATGYLEKAYEVVKKAGGLWISDEVQTGFGRTGENYWGFQTLGNNKFSADIITTAKGIANGFPCGAVLTRREIAESLMNRSMFNTFGGNPLQSAVALETLRVIEEEQLQKNCLERGAELMQGLRALYDKYPTLVGSVRGRGLMCGLEFARNRTSTKCPAPTEAADFFEECKDNGLLLGKGGLHGTCFRIAPPMVASAADVKQALQVMDHSLGVVCRKSG